MQMELPAQALIAAATVVAALIAGLISVVNLTLTKEQKTSEFRQAWIDGLREDLACFFSSSRAVSRAIEESALSGDGEGKNSFEFGNEKLVELRHGAALSYYKIKLRLNPDETDHIELLRLLGRAIEEQNTYFTSRAKRGEPLVALERAADFARPVLKVEWNRVKNGERPFRIVRNGVVPVIVVLCIVFVAFLLHSKFKV